MTLRSSKLQASVVAKPQPSLPLDRITLIGDMLELVGDRGWTVKADSVRFATRLDESRLNWHEIGLNITNLTPDAQLIALFGDTLPQQLALIRVDAHAGLTGPLDRTFPATDPQIAALELSDLQIDWGTLRVTATASVIADSAGFAQGEAVLRLKNWQVALDVAEQVGALTPDQRALWQRAAQFLATQSTEAETIAVPLTFDGGQTRIGPLAVGPAPRLRQGYLQ